MKKIKRIMAMLLAMVMVLGMTVTAMAAGTKPTANDKKEVTVFGLEAGAEVKAYQIIEGKYDDNGFVGYKWVDAVKEGADVKFSEPNVVEGLNSDLITDLAGKTNILGTPVTGEVAAEQTEVALELNAGTWMIIVTPPTEDADKIYNPMIASVYYNVSGSDNGMTGGSVDAGTNWILETTGAYAKSTEITIEKNVDLKDEYSEVGTQVGFTVNTVIPSYSKEYKEVKFVVSDKLVSGLQFTEKDAAPVVMVNGTALKNENEKEYKYKRVDDKNFTITFTEEYIKGLADKSVEERKVNITYTATVTEEAIIQTGENEVTIEYTNKPGETTSSKTDKDDTFTFELNGVLQKVKEDKTSLEGAEFTLYRQYDEDNNTLSDEFARYTTTADGDIKFRGLDADTIYYLKETVAPAGYSLNEHVYKVEIKDITKDSKNGKVISYKVYIDGKEKSEIEYGKPSENFGDQVINTKLSSLPSTGGIGTTIFTIGGCVIMIAAAGLFFASRRKTAK